MRFSLRFLIVELPLLLILAYAVIWNVEGYYDHITTYDRNPWRENDNGIDGILGYLHSVKETPNAISAKDLNLWLRGELPANSRVATSLLYYNSPRSKLDLWDRPYVAVDLDNYNRPTRDPAKAVTVGIYSRGADGISNSDGCDPGDFASWRMILKHDQDEEQDCWRNRKFSALRKLVIGTVGLLVLWIVAAVGYRILFKKA